MPKPFSICVLISGGGTTLRNLIACRDRNELDANLIHVISSSPSAGGIDFAKAAEIPVTVVQQKKRSVGEFSDELFDACRNSKADLIVMGGFLRKVKIPNDYVNRVINIHPSLIPAFCGHGFYGKHVHSGVIEYGCKISGCTVHFVDDEFDHGPIIAQSTAPVLPDDSPDSLAARVFETECKIYPQVINAFANGRVAIKGRVVTIADETGVDLG